MFNFVIVYRRNDRRNQRADRNPRLFQAADGVQSGGMGRRARLEDALQRWIKSRDAHVNRGEIVARHRREDIEVTLDEMSFGNDRDRVTKLLQYLEIGR